MPTVCGLFIEDPNVAKNAKRVLYAELCVCLIVTVCAAAHLIAQVTTHLTINDMSKKAAAGSNATGVEALESMGLPARSMMEGGGGLGIVGVMSVVAVVSSLACVRTAWKGLKTYAAEQKTGPLSMLVFANGGGACLVGLGLAMAAGTGFWFRRASDWASKDEVECLNATLTTDVQDCEDALATGSQVFSMMSFVYFVAIAFLVPLCCMCALAARSADTMSHATGASIEVVSAASSTLRRSSMEGVNIIGKRISSRSSVGSRTSRTSVASVSSAESANTAGSPASPSLLLGPPEEKDQASSATATQGKKVEA